MVASQGGILLFLLASPRISVWRMQTVCHHLAMRTSKMILGNNLNLEAFYPNSTALELFVSHVTDERLLVGTGGIPHGHSW